MPDFALQRRMMVDGQLRTFDIMDPAVLSAMGDMPREDFVAPGEKDVAYIDRELAMLGRPSAPPDVAHGVRAPFAGRRDHAGRHGARRRLRVPGTAAAVLAESPAR